MVADVILAWNGRELIPPPPVTSAQLGLSTDASKLGMGGIFGSHWFSCAWPVHMVHKHINVLEMVAIAAAIFTWGRSWKDIDILVYTDNKPITQIWQTGSTSNPDIMTLLRSLFYFLIARNVNVRLEHVYGYSNVKADLLSRLQVHTFKQHAPEADVNGALVHPQIWDLFEN